MSKITKKIRSGFTIIEVSIFLAITALIFVGMIVGVNSSLTQNHFEDDVRSVVEFLQDAYSKVTSVENDQKGNSDKAIYGKLITFGEGKDFTNTDSKSGDTAFIYDVIGDIAETDTGNTIEALRNLNAKVIRNKTDGTGVEYAGIADSYKTRWGSTIEKTTPSTNNIENDALKAAILIVRSPATGTIFTYGISGSTIDINAFTKAASSAVEDSDRLLAALRNNAFTTQDIDLCINMENKVYGGKRKNIRVKAMARSSADVQVIPLDSADNRCQ